MTEARRCPLCLGASPRPLDGGRLDCRSCGLVAREPSSMLPLDAERARYLLHRNSPDDAGYRAFLARLAAPLLERVPPGAEGLDYGCGPGPALAGMLIERGLRCSVHDPLFADDPSALRRTWDFVTASEVVEHLRDPRASWIELAALVRPGGWLGVMTRTLPAEHEARPDGWWYARDPTHVMLYREITMEWIAAWLGLGLERAGRGVFLFRAAPDPAGAPEPGPGPSGGGTDDPRRRASSTSSPSRP